MGWDDVGSTSTRSGSPSAPAVDTDSAWLRPSGVLSTAERRKRTAGSVVGVVMVAFLAYFFVSNFVGQEADPRTDRSAAQEYYEFADPVAAATARSEITAALTTAFDVDATPEHWLAAVDASQPPGERLAGFLATCGSSDVIIDDLYFLSEDEATMFFHFENTSVPGAAWLRFNGAATLRDGAWVVSADTVNGPVETSPFCG